MLGALPSYSQTIKTAFHYLKPGTGWLECHEMLLEPRCDDGTVPDNWAPRTWYAFVEEGAKKSPQPRDFSVAEKLAGWMREAGFVDVKEETRKIPLNPWAKDPTLKQIGRLWERNWMDGISPFSYNLLGPDGLGWTQNEIEVFLMDVRTAVRDSRVHSYQKVYFVYGRRPSKTEGEAMDEPREGKVLTPTPVATSTDTSGCEAPTSKK